MRCMPQPRTSQLVQGGRQSSTQRCIEAGHALLGEDSAFQYNREEAAGSSTLAMSGVAVWEPLPVTVSVPVHSSAASAAVAASSSRRTLKLEAIAQMMGKKDWSVKEALSQQTAVELLLYLPILGQFYTEGKAVLFVTSPRYSCLLGVLRNRSR